MGGRMKTKEVYLYSDEIDEDLFHAIERQLGCHEANLSLFNGRSEKERVKDFECAAYKSNNCKNPKDNVYIIKLQVIDHEHTVDDSSCECCFQTS